MKVFAAILVVLTLFTGGLWVAGKSEPVYDISGSTPAFFAAVKLTSPDKRISLAPGVTARLITAPDFSLIGPNAPYWDRYLLLSGGDGSMPLVEDEAMTDAFVARVTLTKPLPPLLGIVRLANWMGLTTPPDGIVDMEVLEAAARPDILPHKKAVTELLAKDGSYQPHMMNFLKYRQTADYPDTYKGKTDVSGAEAYERYGTVALRTVMRTGGTLMFHGTVDHVLRSSSGWPDGNDWDEVAMMRYPNPSAILSMESADDYRAALVDRDAGIDRTIVIASSPQ